jgi:hypothetical protein
MNGEPQPGERPRSDYRLLLATAGISLVGAVLAGAVWVIESGFSQLREEAFPLRTESGIPVPRFAGAKPPPVEEPSAEPTAFLGLDLQHRLPSGLLSVFVDGKLMHEEPLAVRPRKLLLFRVAPSGEVRLSLPVAPGPRRVALRLQCDALGIASEAEATVRFGESDWRLLLARLRPEDNRLELRWGL